MKRILAFLLLLAPFASAQVVVNPGGGGSATSSGSTISGCTSSILYADASSLLKCDPAAVVNGSVSTAGRSILTIRDTILGDGTQSFLNVTGAMPGTLTANVASMAVSTAADNDAWVQYGIRSSTSGTGPGSGAVVAIQGDNAETSSGYSYAIRGNVGGSVSTGVGVAGLTYAGTNKIGGYFALANQNPPAASGALIVDNAAVAANIFEARDNGTAVFTIADGGAATFAGTVALNAQTNVASGQFIGIGPNSLWSALYANTALTPDASEVLVGSASNSVALAEFGDSAYDFQNGRCATSACTDPSLIIHSHNQATTEYVQASNDGTLAHIDGQAGTNGVGQYAFAGSKTLTEASATVVVDIPVASGAYTGATINWTVVASDATDHSSRRGSTYLAVINKAGTETCTVGDVGTTVLATSGAATLTVTTGQDTTGTNVCTFTINATSSLTQTVLRAYYSVQMDGPGIPTAR